MQGHPKGIRPPQSFNNTQRWIFRLIYFGRILTLETELFKQYVLRIRLRIGN